MPPPLLCFHRHVCTRHRFDAGTSDLTCHRWYTQLAAIFEFGGALLLGRVSTGVIQGGIANLTTFQSEPAVYAYGMVCALAVGGVWQGIASYLELNVSATHSISESL
jgi:phosphate/sulfate permease